SEPLATEKLVRLAPCFLCYAPAPHAPDVAPAPSLGPAGVTFGSFNTYAKMSPPCLDAWAGLLGAVPASRLFLKNIVLGDPTIVERTRALFAERGIDASRLELRGETRSKAEHMGTYAQIDIALDPFPYHGTTT